MKKYLSTHASAIFRSLAIMTAAIGVVISAPVTAQTKDSHLVKIMKSQELRVCQWPGYYAITYINPTTNELEGIDIDLAHELAKELDAKVTFVPSSFATFSADLLTGKCDIGMFGLGATLNRAKAVEFSKPYLMTGVYGVVRKGGKIASWDDVDQEGIKVGVSMGSYLESFLQGHLQNATVVSVQPPATREAELAGQRIDVVMTDYPAAHKFETEFDWAMSIAPEDDLALTPYAYAIAPGDQRWLNYINLFIETIQRDGRLQKYAEKNGMGPIVVHGQ